MPQLYQKVNEFQPLLHYITTKETSVSLYEIPSWAYHTHFTRRSLMNKAMTHGYWWPYIRRMLRLYLGNIKPTKSMRTSFTYKNWATSDHMFMDIRPMGSWHCQPSPKSKRVLTFLSHGNKLLYQMGSSKTFSAHSQWKHIEIPMATHYISIWHPPWE